MAKAVETDEFKRFLDQLPIAILVSKQMGGEQRLVYANAAFEKLADRSMSDIAGRGWAILDAFHREDDPAVRLDAAVLAGDDFVGTFRRETAGQPPIIVQAYASAIEDDSGVERFRIAALVDVTARELAQREEFERQIRDKDLLLREIQHRVRNNLQLIIALIRLDTRRVRNAGDVDTDRLAARIEALQIIYCQLASNPVNPDVDLGQYLGEIAAALMKAYAVEGMRLDIKVETILLPVNVAMSVGLVVNELLTNAFKYAFIDRDDGIITIRCERREDKCHVLVGDNGRGFPDGVVWPCPGKVSDLMLTSLRENTKADVHVESSPGNGVRVRISFPIPPAKVQ